MFKPGDLFDLGQTEHAVLFDNVEYAWEVLKRIKDYVETNVRPGGSPRIEGHAFIGDRVQIGEGTVIEDGAMIKGPAIIGKNCQIRHNAYIREHVIIGDNCVVGNSCEFKNALLFNGCQVPHFNYVGDSILGFKAHIGAGVILSNFRSLPGSVKVQAKEGAWDTGFRKFGALIGDGSEVGCNAVLNPGSIVGRGSIIYPGVNWRGYLPPGSIAKNRGELEIVVRKERSGQ